MRAEHARLSRALALVTSERDLAVREKRQLQAKLENLEQVLKVGGRLPPAQGPPVPERTGSDSSPGRHQHSGLSGLFWWHKKRSVTKFKCFWKRSRKTNYAIPSHRVLNTAERGMVGSGLLASRGWGCLRRFHTSCIQGFWRCSRTFDAKGRARSENCFIRVRGNWRLLSRYC